MRKTYKNEELCTHKSSRTHLEWSSLLGMCLKAHLCMGCIRYIYGTTAGTRDLGMAIKADMYSCDLDTQLSAQCAQL